MVQVMPLSPSDFGARMKESYSRGGVLIGDKLHCRWMGYAELKPGLQATELDIITPSMMKTQPDVPAMLLPQGAVITSIGFRPQENLILGNATGRVKVASALADGIGPAATDGYNAYSPAAVGGVVTRPSPTDTNIYFNKTFTLFGSAGVMLPAITRYKIYATDSTGQAATTMSCLKACKILFAVGFYCQGPWPTELTVGKSFYTAP